MRTRSLIVACLFLTPWLAVAAPMPGGRLAEATTSSVARIAAEAERRFHGVGVVTGVDEDSGVVAINHQAIPGLMDAMEMAFKTARKSLAKGLRAGDLVEFDLDGKTYTILDLKKAASP